MAGEQDQTLEVAPAEEAPSVGRGRAGKRRRRGGGFMAWTGSWWPASGRFGSTWGGEPRPIPGTGAWIDCESELAADQWRNDIWHRAR